MLAFCTLDMGALRWSFPFGRMPSLTPSRGPRCTSYTASCLWLRACPGNPELPLPAELAAAVSWTCPQETPVRLGCCNWMCPYFVPSFGDPACLTQCACTAKVRHLPLHQALVPFPELADATLLPSSLGTGWRSFSSLVPAQPLLLVPSTLGLLSSAFPFLIQVLLLRVCVCVRACA